MPPKRSAHAGFISAKEKARREAVVKANKKRSLIADENITLESVGRRIVNIQHIGKEMWCNLCDSALSFRDIVEEKRNGLSSIFLIRCRTCLVVKPVSTDSKTAIHGQELFDSNLKGAIAMIDAGIGPSQMNSMLSALNIPALSESLLKRHERVIGPVLEDIAQESCLEAIHLEKSLSQESPKDNGEELFDASNAAHSTPAVKIVASYDMGWQKRGTGRTYDSLTGHGSLIGDKSRKVLQYGTRNKSCRKCANGHDKSDHDCRRNFSGSAKAMEPNLAVALVNSRKLKEASVAVGVFVGDDDSSTISAVQRASSCPVSKWSDLNHAKKGLSNLLYGLQKKHKVLNTASIVYLKRCFSYALEQNKNNVEGTQQAIVNVVEHAFDNHDHCGQWCHFSANPSEYKHKGLPNGQGFQGEELKRDLKNIFAKLAQNASKLAPCRSTQANESFNMMVSSKAPKAKFYGWSESLDYRVASAVCQKNVGTSYILNVNKKLGVSPGRNSEAQRRMKDLLRMRRSIKCATKSFKGRRLFIKKNRGQQKYAEEAKEGITYKKDMGLSVLNNPVSMAPNVIGSNTFVYIDLETTGFSKTAEICQIAVAYEDTNISWNILPRMGFSHHASEVNRMCVSGGKLLRDGVALPTVLLNEALEEMMNFLECLGDVILVGHNLVKFDLVYLMRDLYCHGMMTRFQKVVKGLLDSLSLFRQSCPGLPSYSLVNLAKHHFGDEACLGAHDASWDVALLMKVMLKFGISRETMKQSAVSLEDHINKENAKRNFDSNLATLSWIHKGGISTAMVRKMASSGICKTMLCETFDKDGEEGISLLLSEDVGGKPRVTKNKKIIVNILNLLREIN